MDEKHWDGLPTGAGRRVTAGDGGQIEVGRRPLSVYDELTGTRPFTTKPSAKESS
ncbi:hypothetical protein [Streptomyces sp. NPDC054797]